MNKILKTTLIVIGLSLLAGGSLFAGWLFANNRARSAAFAPSYLMRGYDWKKPAYAQSPAFGPGMMGGRGGMMGGRAYSGYRPGMMGGYRSGLTDLQPLSIAQAEGAAQEYINNLGVDGLKIGEVMVFDNHAYVRVVETSTGIGAFELLVDPVTTSTLLSAGLAVYPEHGANMMWNLKYGGLNHAQHLIGQNMMGGRRGMMSGQVWNTTPADVPAEMTVTDEQALEYAQKFLDANLSGATAAAEAEPFYGYYTIDVLRDGRIVGMLSVNGFSAQVFYHYWHGTFIEMSEE
ncbi:MAG: hypothetical protein QMD04_00735 [Anaerolineales bacterium]|nr:hypothetical protein [Anaerolineales bacterium]